MNIIKHAAVVTVMVLATIFILRKIPVVGDYTNKALVG